MTYQNTRHSNNSAHGFWHMMTRFAAHRKGAVAGRQTIYGRNGLDHRALQDVAITRADLFSATCGVSGNLR